MKPQLSTTGPFVASVPEPLDTVQPVNDVAVVLVHLRIAAPELTVATESVFAPALNPAVDTTCKVEVGSTTPFEPEVSLVAGEPSRCWPYLSTMNAWVSPPAIC